MEVYHPHTNPHSPYSRTNKSKYYFVYGTNFRCNRINNIFQPIQRPTLITRVSLSLTECKSIEQQIQECVKIVAEHAWKKSNFSTLFDVLFGNGQNGSHGMVHLHVLWFAVLCGGGFVLGVAMLPLVGLAWEVYGKALVLPLEQLANQKLQQFPKYLHGVDIRDSQLFLDPEVLSAVEYASFYHKDQTRKTGEPYIVHCIQTALIVEQYLICARVQGGPMLKNVVIAAVLHDVVSDANVSITDVQERFGVIVTELVQEVSNMSAINQLMRRTRRHGSGAVNEGKILEMILNATRDPFSIIIKLADRVHNMRTAYVLKPDRQMAIAAETQSLWCRLAEKLGLFELKSELEDLCFAVLQPEEFRKILTGLNNLWGPRVTPKQIPQQSIVGSLLPFNQDILTPKPIQKSQKSPFLKNISAQQPAGSNFQKPLSDEQQDMKWLLKNVLPFHYSYFQQVLYSQHSQEALKVLGSCASKLYQEIRVESAAVGHDVEIYGRIKSLYSMFKKMNRKKIPLEEVYDARALRVVVDDSDTSFNSESAISACYRLLPLVQRLWKKIPREDDDYIANPKRRTGYQSLHTAVIGPDGRPMEVQIRTRSMHQAAEYGQAAHWVYKEGGTTVQAQCDCEIDTEYQIKIGHPVLKVNNGNLWDGVVVSSGINFIEVAVWMPCRLKKQPQGVVGQTRAPLFKYANLYRYALTNGLLAEVNSYDAFMKIEKYMLKNDRYCLSDHLGKRYSDRYVSILELCREEIQLMQQLIQQVIQDEQKISRNPRSTNIYPFNIQKPNFKMDLEDYGINNPAAQTSTSDNEIEFIPQNNNQQQNIHKNQYNSNNVKENPQKFQQKNQIDDTFEQKNQQQQQQQQQIQQQQQQQQYLQQQNKNQNQNQYKKDDISARSILRLRQQLGSIEYQGDKLDLQQKEKYISVFTWPDGDVSEIESGSTAEDLIRNMGKITILNSDSMISEMKNLINVNNQLVSPKTVLKNGDYVVLGDQILDI